MTDDDSHTPLGNALNNIQNNIATFSSNTNGDGVVNATVDCDVTNGEVDDSIGVNVANSNSVDVAHGNGVNIVNSNSVNIAHGNGNGVRPALKVITNTSNVGIGKMYRKLVPQIDVNNKSMTPTATSK